ncbi:MAG: hypothetical protein HOV83_22000 [Catenulispora sp.]|nr:hypothetical protein [Catenulispora sp.]
MRTVLATAIATAAAGLALLSAAPASAGVIIHDGPAPVQCGSSCASAYPPGPTVVDPSAVGPDI